MSEIAVKLASRIGEFDLDVDFAVPATGVTALFGHSGSGKTSVLRAMAGLLRADRGEVRVNGCVWQDAMRFVAPYRRAIGYVFQEPSLFPHLSVARNLRYGLKRTPKADQRITFDEIVELLEIGPLLGRHAHALSGGERQRVAIGRALLSGPRLLLMDEPLSALDLAAKRSILPYLETLFDRLDLPVFYVSHDPVEVARLADNIVALASGRAVAVGKATEIMTRLDLPLAADDHAESILEGYVSSHEDTYHLTWVGMNCGRLAMPRQHVAIGHHVRVAIAARDVSLALRSHSDISILNVLAAEIIDTRERGEAELTVRLRLLGGQLLLARITRRSAVALGLREGMRVYAQVKSAALVT